ncbi:MAG: uroporphyrinogen decarboxylase family protein [bacterium]
MTARERLLAALQGRKPDRVPVTLFIIDQGHFLNQMCPGVATDEHLQLQLKVIELQKQFGCDVFVRVLYGLMDPLSLIYGGVDVSQQTDDWRVSTEEHRDGSTRIQRSTIRTPAGTLTQEFAIAEMRPGTFCYNCIRHPISCMKDLEIASRYEPSMPPHWEAHARRWLGTVKAAVGDAGIVGSWSPYGPYNTGSLLVDLNTLYGAPLVEPEFHAKLMEFAIRRSTPYLRAIDAAGVDVHCIGGNVGGGMIGRRVYDEHLLSYERRYIEIVQENGTPGMYHNCGQIMDLVDSYKALGVKAVEPFSPPPLGDCDDLAAARRQVDGAYAVLSGIDQVNVLQKGTVDDVKRATEKAIRAGKEGGGGFILQPVDFLEYGTPEENVQAYVETALDLAAY